MGEGPEPMVSPLGEVEEAAGLHSPENKESEDFYLQIINILVDLLYCSIHHHLEALVCVAGGQGLPRCRVTGL